MTEPDRMPGDPAPGREGAAAPITTHTVDGMTAPRAARRPRRRPRRARLRLFDVVLLAAALAISAAVLVSWRWSAEPARQPLAATASSPSHSRVLPQVEVLPAVEPTPVFASYRSMRLHLPVPDAAVTQLAFHQAAGPSALHMKALVPYGKLGTAAKTKEMRRLPSETGSVEAAEISAAEAGTPEVFNGEALRMWRSNRQGEPDTAADVGALPGTPVVAPVSGTILAVRSYKLYGSYPDLEIHIQPDGWPELDVVLIHVTDATVETGDTVDAGETVVAQVRRLADKVQPQLGRYTRDAGDHVHMQLNLLEVPGRINPPVGGS